MILRIIFLGALCLFLASCSPTTEKVSQDKQTSEFLPVLQETTPSIPQTSYPLSGEVDASRASSNRLFTTEEISTFLKTASLFRTAAADLAVEAGRKSLPVTKESICQECPGHAVFLVCIEAFTRDLDPKETKAAMRSTYASPVLMNVWNESGVLRGKGWSNDMRRFAPIRLGLHAQENGDILSSEIPLTSLPRDSRLFGRIAERMRDMGQYASPYYLEWLLVEYGYFGRVGVPNSMASNPQWLEIAKEDLKHGEFERAADAIAILIIFGSESDRGAAVALAGRLSEPVVPSKIEVEPDLEKLDHIITLYRHMQAHPRALWVIENIAPENSFTERRGILESEWDVLVKEAHQALGDFRIYDGEIVDGKGDIRIPFPESTKAWSGKMAFHAKRTLDE